MDATARGDSTMRQYGNCISGDELSPGPVLCMIAQEPDTAEAKIKRRRLSSYLQAWFTDEGLNIKLHYLVESIVRHWDEHEEDLNVFVVMRNKIFYSYYGNLEDYINGEYEERIATHIVPKMKKKEMRAIAEKEFPASTYKNLKKMCKRIRKSLKLEDRQDFMVLDDMDAL